MPARRQPSRRRKNTAAVAALLAANTEELGGIKAADENAERKVGKQFPPGIMRRLFTPAEIDLALYGSGLPMQHVVYYHTHWIPPVFENDFPRFYNKLSLLFDCLGDTPAGAYLSSCFLAVAQKPA